MDHAGSGALSMRLAGAAKRLRFRSRAVGHARERRRSRFHEPQTVTSSDARRTAPHQCVRSGALPQEIALIDLFERAGPACRRSRVSTPRFIATSRTSQGCPSRRRTSRRESPAMVFTVCPGVSSWRAPPGGWRTARGRVALAHSETARASPHFESDKTRHRHQHGFHADRRRRDEDPLRRPRSRSDHLHLARAWRGFSPDELNHGAQWAVRTARNIRHDR